MNDKRLTVIVCGLLGLGTLAIFWAVRHHDFIVYDDQDYVVGNLMVQRGLTWAGTVWAFTTFHASNWHPLTWLSHMLDCQLYGLKPGGHHFTSLLLHSANAALLFLMLKRLTGALWRSALVAALFALHPLHVESWAWVAERKDVLAAFFFMLTLVAYERYSQKAESRKLKAEMGTAGAESGNPKSEIRSPKEARKPKSEARGPVSRFTFHVSRFTHYAPRSTLHSTTFYLLSLLCFACGLMSKPMLVTVPFVLLLLDYWPLRRMQKAKAEIRIPKSEIRRKPEIRTPKSELQSRITFHVSRFTFHVSRPTFHAPRFTFHVSRSLLLEKTPFFLLSAASCLVTCLAQVRGGAVETLERVPLGARLANAAVGYLGYLEKTVWPAKLSILYLRPPHWPLGRIGLAILVLTGISLLVLRLGRGRGWLSVGWLWFLGMLVPVSGIMQAGNQYMADRYSYLPLIGLFIIVAWAVGGNPKAEIRDPKEVRNPKSESAPAKAFHVSPHTLHVSRFTFHTLRSTLLTLVLACLAALAVHQSGFWRNSETLFGHCLAVTSDNYVAHNNLGAALAQQGRMAEARTNFMAAWHIQPHDADTLFNVGVLLTQEGKFGEAAPLLAEAAGIKPELGAKYGKLALVLEAQGHTDQAIACYREGLRLRPGQMETANNLAWILATTPDVKLRDGSEAVRLAQQACEWSGYQQPVVVGTLAAAYAEAGRFPEAVATAERAIALATAAGQPALVERNRQLLDLYRAGKPCRSR